MTTRPLRRLIAVLACLAVALLPQPATSARGSGSAALGERGSGPAQWRTAIPAATNGIVWSDVTRKHWARTAIDFVGATNEWMRDSRAAVDGSYAFKPDVLESRRLFARTLYRAFGSELVADETISFDDLPPEHRFYPAASLAVSQGWIEMAGTSFLPNEPVTTRVVHRALVLALGLGDLAAGADALHLRDGTEVPTPEGFGTLLLGMRLGLRYNHGDEALDVGPDTPLPRAEVAWSLYRAATAPTWVRDSLAPYATMELPNLSAKMLEVVSWGAGYVGYPYIWGGDWGEATPDAYCCGWQPQGGFDCSGVTWWAMKKASAGWDNTPPRAYAGWDLPERSSAQMASVGLRLRWDEIRPGDLLFYDGNEDGTVDHVDTYLGNGWALDSGSSNAGVTITYVAGTWYEDHFVHARRLTSAVKS
ncbi:MAG: C40 family peptidase [Actinomycetota bacterium]